MVPARPENIDIAPDESRTADTGNDSEAVSASDAVRESLNEQVLKKNRRRVKKVVLDTSLFVNPDVRASLGATPIEALETFLCLAAQIGNIEFYMPPSIFDELLHFVERDKIPGDLLVILHQKPPKKHELKCPAFLLYELIEDIRERVNKGLRLAEKAVRSAELKKPDEIVQDLRKKYREALREGIIDSKEDVDLMLLAMELDALLITADQGLIKWAEKLGIEWLFPERFKDYLEAAVKRTKMPEGKAKKTTNRPQ
ncbi:MAG TPA: RNA ligase partner protein [Dissulfurispiraceae bacterium]|nr:RNA ligase partner protein [Dissulfurispiraceae bacterium]